MRCRSERSDALSIRRAVTEQNRHEDLSGLLDEAGDGRRLTVLLKYRHGLRPTEAEKAYREAVPGLEVGRSWPRSSPSPATPNACGRPWATS